jgi:glycosyltransferase involved in cell wall biosynthesis
MEVHTEGLSSSQREDMGPFSILHTEWANSWGGQVQRVLLECTKMTALGHKVVIACQPGTPLLRNAREKGIPAEEVRIRGQFDLRAIRDIYRVIRKYGITVVNTHSSRDNWVGSLAAKLAGVPLLVRTRHHPVPISNSPLNFVHKLTDGVIATGEAVRAGLITDNSLPEDRVVSIPTGVSLERFSPEIDPLPLRRELGISPATRVVSIVARLGKGKRHDVFLDAARMIIPEIGDIKFLIVGDGAMKESIEQTIVENDLSRYVLMTGHRSDIPEVMAASDVVVLTSDSEGVPQVLTQAMVMERPVVAAPIGAIPDLIEDGVTGLFAAAGNARSFADRILTLLRDDGLCQTLGRAARQHVLNHFTDEIMAEKTIDFYRRLLKIKQGKTA